MWRLIPMGVRMQAPVFLAVLASLLGFSGLSPAGAMTGPEVIARMQKRFAESKSFSARFEKRFYWAVLKKEVIGRGTMYTRKPGQFRVETEDGDLVVSDGVSVWAYVVDNEQVIVTPSSGELRTPWEILTEYSEGFAPVDVKELKIDGRSAYVLTLEPQDGASYVAAGGQVVVMRVWVDKKEWFLLKVEQLEANDDLRTYILSKHKRNAKFKDDLFTFLPPEDVEVIDRRPVDLGNGQKD
jgi:outer membrane lipoprotein-sorting protein